VRAEVLSEVCVVARESGLMRDLKMRIAASRKELLRLLDRRNLSFNRRLRIGDLLGTMGDPRLESGPVANLHWVNAGKREIGRASNHLTRIPKYQSVPAAPKITGNVGRFAVGQFVVTNVEYRKFIVEAGYATRRYWPPEGWMWISGDERFLRKLITFANEAAPIHLSSEILGQRLVPDDIPDQCERMIRRSAPMYLSDQAHNRPNQPIVGVNWWEAYAYCRWLDELLHSSAALANDLQVRLPTEAEWETAARSCAGDSPHPWQSGLASENAHVRVIERQSDEARALRSCGVGSFPFVGPVYDVVGNVWEWTASFAEPYSAKIFDQTVQESGLFDRVARGSSWLSSEVESTEITFRSFDPPYNAYEDLGFRICVSGRV
jgi:formylglycine-generating enzyme required for sulfatase activity